jgi:nucleotide-binding universal stress UspA family protein
LYIALPKIAFIICGNGYKLHKVYANYFKKINQPHIFQPFMRREYNKPESTTILVTCDFTEQAYNAFEYALKMSHAIQNVKDDITLVHIIENKLTYDLETKRLDVFAQDIFHKYGVKPKTLIRTGSIFRAIGKAAEEVNAELVVMGTHGRHGIQKLVGSWALRVVVHSKVPFVTIQDKPKEGEFRKIVFPIDFRMENREELVWVNYLCKHYNAKIFIVHTMKKDRGFRRGTKSNIYFTKNYLEGRGIEYEISHGEGGKEFSNEVIKYAQSIDADLILIMTTKGITLIDYLFGAPEQAIIANEAKIPVMCVNPRPSKLGGFRAQGGA